MKAELLLDSRWDGDVRYRSMRGQIMHGVAQCHDELEMNLVVRGRGLYVVGKSRYELRRDSIVWLFPTQEHTLVDVSPDLELWVVFVKARALTSLHNNEATRLLTELDPIGQFCRCLQPQAARQVGDILQTLFQLRDGLPQKLELWNAGLPYALLTAWDVYCNAGDEVPSFEIHPAVKRAMQLLSDERHNSCSDGAWLARQVGLNASRLGKLFHEQIGMSLVDFRNRQRLYRFFQIYGRGWKLPLVDAAMQAGFGSYPQFYRVLREFTGYSPAEIRRMAQQEEFSFDFLLSSAND